MNRKRAIIVVASALLLAFLFLVVSFTREVNRGQLKARSAQIRTESKDLAMALTQYANACGALPGGDAVAIVAALRGENLKRQVFMEISAERIDASHRYLDPWGTPYEIEIRGKDLLAVRSAGKNRNFGDKDDVAFEQILAATNKSTTIEPTSK